MIVWNKGMMNTWEVYSIKKKHYCTDKLYRLCLRKFHILNVFEKVMNKKKAGDIEQNLC